ncbi:MAG: hypothetical protein VB080_06620 [Propionicimonas sp.]|uniref:heavy-metal-associated domain-containing protein n=1 Tax=Propionicimonas sp. TaxID=1955623 RepID=UPI002B21CA94|nr:hypothetical protein [Propionicimonas sp.]MEA4944098.1 hypothetical protein [Propionicimonas sp.]MEA5055355.1 hypothetical protein [Propionicimonas sp.]
MERSATYGVRGLACVGCLVSVIEEVRALPGVNEVGVDLMPFGESLLTVVPAGAATTAQVRASMRRVGFEYIGRRNNRRHERPKR